MVYLLGLYLLLYLFFLIKASKEVYFFKFHYFFFIMIPGSLLFVLIALSIPEETGMSRVLLWLFGMMAAMYFNFKDDIFINGNEDQIKEKLHSYLDIKDNGIKGINPMQMRIKSGMSPLEFKEKFNEVKNEITPEIGNSSKIVFGLGFIIFLIILSGI